VTEEVKGQGVMSMSRACFRSAILTVTFVQFLQCLGAGSHYSQCQGSASPSDGQAASPKISESPLDSLQRANIPANEMYPWQPAELVAVIGTHRGMHFGWITSIRYCPDGKTIASAGEDGVIRFWDSQLREIGSLKSDGVVTNCLAFSRNGKWFAAARRDGSVRLWRTSGLVQMPTEHPSLLLKVKADAVGTLALSPDGRLLACDESDKIRIWALDEGGATDYALLDSASVAHLLFSPDGSYLACARGYGQILLWDVGKRTPVLSAILSVDDETHITDIAFSQDGSILGCVSSDGRIWLWNISGGRAEKHTVFETARDTFMSIEFVLGDAMVATGTLGGVLALWEIKGGDRQMPVWRKEIGYAICALASAPGGKALASVSRDDGSIAIWDVTRSAAELRCPESAPVVTSTIAWLADSGKIICGRTDGKLEIWGLAKAVPEKLEEFGTIGDTIWSLGISSTADMIASCSRFCARGDLMPGNINLWKLDKGKPAIYAVVGEICGASRGLALTPKENLLSLCALGDRTIRFLDLTDGKLGERFRLEPEVNWFWPKYAVSFSTDGRFLATLCDVTLLVWDRGDLSRKPAVLEGSSAFVSCVAFSPDCSTLASGGDGLVDLWKIKGAEFKKSDTLRGHSSWVNAVSFSPDGKALVSVDSDGRVILWRSEGGVRLKQWDLDGPVDEVAYAPDGRHIALLNGNGTVYILRLE